MRTTNRPNHSPTTHRQAICACVPFVDLEGRQLPAGRQGPRHVFVLTDDLSTDLVRFMSHARRWSDTGSRSRATSCPTRSPAPPRVHRHLTRDFPHDTQVFGNFASTSGVQAFHWRGGIAAHLRGRAPARRLPNRHDGQAPQRLHAGRWASGRRRHHGRRPATFRPAGANETRRLGLRRVQLHAQENGVRRGFGQRPSESSPTCSPQRRRLHARRGRPLPAVFRGLTTFAPHCPYVPAPETDPARSDRLSDVVIGGRAEGRWSTGRRTPVDPRAGSRSCRRSACLARCRTSRQSGGYRT